MIFNIYIYGEIVKHLDWVRARCSGEINNERFF